MVAYVRRHLQGHIQYFGVSGNSRSLQEYVYQAGRLLLQDGNHRYEALTRARAPDAWVLVYFDDPVERDRFVAREQHASDSD